MPTPVTRTTHGRASLIGRNRVAPGRRAENQAVPLKPGQVRCNVCGNGYTPLADGRARAHQSRPGISCPAVQSNSSKSSKYVLLCEHGNASLERADTCRCPRNIRPEETS